MTVGVFDALRVGVAWLRELGTYTERLLPRGCPLPEVALLAESSLSLAVMAPLPTRTDDWFVNIVYSYRYSRRRNNQGT